MSRRGDRQSVPRAHRLAILSYDGISLFEFATGHEVCALQRPPDTSRYKATMCVVDGVPPRIALPVLQMDRSGYASRPAHFDSSIVPGRREIDEFPLASWRA